APPGRGGRFTAPPAGHTGGRRLLGAPARASGAAGDGLRRCAAAGRGDGVPAVRDDRGDARRRGRLLGDGRLMQARVWGCRGSLAAPGADTIRYGGNTSCVEVVLE